MASDPVLMPLSKRLLDIALALALGLLLLPLILLISAIILVLDGGPVFYVSERMRTPSRAFGLVKFRSMRPVGGDGGVTGADKAERITRSGRFLRRSRLDEVPQLWNILWGDMSFVGPRPPLRVYVEDYPDLYRAVLRSRPGLTGLATVTYAAHEARLLAKSRSAQETDAIYGRACVPRKARLDLIYQSNRSLCLDIRLMLLTVLGRPGLGRPGRRSGRRWLG